MNLVFENYRFAEEILISEKFRVAYQHAEDVFRRLPAVRRGAEPWSTKAPHPKFSVDQDGMNRWLDAEFRPDLGWVRHPRITQGTKLEGDYRRDRIQIEAQFGNMARWTYDILKFQICYSQNEIDVGMLVVPVQWFAKLIGDNIAYFERIRRELPHAKLSITLPILVIGLDPGDDQELAPLRESLGREARLDEQWDDFLNAWATAYPDPITAVQLADDIFRGESPLMEVLPEDVGEGLGGDLRTFQGHFNRLLNRSRARSRLEQAGRGARGAILWRVASEGSAVEE